MGNRVDTAVAPAVATIPSSPPGAGPVRTLTVALHGDNIALGRPYSLSEAPNYELCSDVDDARQLTDGRFSQGWFWTDRQTVGWRFKKRVIITIDLGSVKSINTISFNTCGNSDTGSRCGVYLPDAWFLVSVDGEEYHRVASFHGKKIPDLPNTYVRRFQADDLGVAARYVAVAVIPTGMFAFCDEIEVLRGGDGQPASGPAVRLDNLWTIQGQDRLAAGLRFTVGGNLAVAGRSAALAALAGRPDNDWLVANAQLAADRFPGQALIGWSRDIWQDYSRCTLPPAGAATPAGIHLVMGDDEYESAGIALTNATSRQLLVHARVSALMGPGGSLLSPVVRVDAFSDCIDGIERPDALPLLDDAGAVIEPGSTRQVWLTARTGGQQAGTYAGRLSMTSEVGVIEVPISVEVLSVTLPQPLPVDAVAWSYLNLPLVRADPAAAVKDLADHRITTTALECSTLPQFAVAADGSLTKAEYGKFDAAIRRFREAGIRKFIFFGYYGDGSGLKSIMGCNVAAPKDMRLGDPAWRVAMTAVTTAWVKRCQDLGMGYGDFAFYPFDEPSDDLLRKGAPVYAAIRAADPRARVFMTVVHESTPPVLATVASCVDVWCHHLNRGQPFAPAKLPFYRERMTAGSVLWLYNAQEPDKSFHPLGHYRRLFWSAWEVGATGAGVWNYADTGWGSSTSAWTDLDGKREDFSLVYDVATAPPGISQRETQIPSRRWEAFRDGIEDYAYLWALRQAVDAARARGTPDLGAEAVLAESVVSIAADSTSGNAYAAVHQRLLRALAATRKTVP